MGHHDWEASSRMCPLCDLFGIGGIVLALGPRVATPLLRWVPWRWRQWLPLTFVAAAERLPGGGWQSLPPIPPAPLA